MKTETVVIDGLYGPVGFTREATAGPAAGPVQNGFKLRLGFSEITHDIKDSLKALGFRCHHEERVWELPPAAYSQQREAALRALLEGGELPGSPTSPKAATPTKAGNKHRRNGQEIGPTSPTAAAAAARGSFEQQSAAAEQAMDEEQQLQEQEAQEGEIVVHLHEGSAAHVVLRRGADGFVELEGAGVWNIRPMLERILHFSEVPVAAGTAACTGVGAPVPRWRSAWPLSGAEAAFVEGVLEHRKRSLRNPRHDDREPIPLGLVVPPRFRPRSKDGLAMRGPMLCRQGDPHNIGRQFFGPVQREGGGGILWADGTQPSIDEEQQRFNEKQLRELEDREDWEEDVPQESQSGDWGDAGGEEGVDQGFFD